MNALWNEFRFAIRILLTAPRFSAAVVLTLAIGIASSSMVFSVAQSVFLRPMPYPDFTRLAYVSQVYPGFPEGGGQFSYPTYRDILQQNTTFDQLAAYQVSGPLALTGEGDSVRLPVTYCTPSYFSELGIHPMLGRVFGEQEDRPGGGSFVVVLSYAFWQRQFGGAPNIVGRTIHLNDRPFEVIGVLPEDFRDSLYEQEFGEEGNAWIPLGLAYTMTGYSNPTDRVAGILWAIGHLKPAVTIKDARADLSALAAHLEKTYPDSFRGYGLVARLLKDQLLGEFLQPCLDTNRSVRGSLAHWLRQRQQSASRAASDAST